jgi:hypothetical protein
MKSKTCCNQSMKEYVTMYYCLGCRRIIEKPKEQIQAELRAVQNEFRKGAMPSKGKMLLQCLNED